MPYRAKIKSTECSILKKIDVPFLAELIIIQFYHGILPTKPYHSKAHLSAKLEFFPCRPSDTGYLVYSFQCLEDHELPRTWWARFLYLCLPHPCEIRYVPHSCKSWFCSVCAKVQIDKWVADMNRLFPNCSYFHVTFTVPSQFRTLLFEKRELLNAVFSASTETLISFCKEQGFLPAVTAVLHTFCSDLKRHVHVHVIISAGGLKLSGKATICFLLNKLYW